MKRIRLRICVQMTMKLDRKSSSVHHDHLERKREQLLHCTPGIVIVFQEEDFGVIKETEKNKSNLRLYCEKSRS